MSLEKPEPVWRLDYRPPDYFVDSVDLHFDLDPALTVVCARLAIRRNPDLRGDPPPLVLDGEELELHEVRIDERVLDAREYRAEPDKLVIERVPASFELETVVAIKPQDNTQLSGLYQSSGIFCTQCEAMGFRRITFFPDRPDVMCTWSTTIVAPRESAPVMLSNGNRVDEGELDGGFHWVRWEDPWRKPSYLFALVAGELRCHAGAFTTASGRDVRLEIWVEPANIDRCEHALVSLRKAMEWDEQRYGREYDLDVYMIVAVNDFNMGAMENKGLNVFNSKFVLARPETATDDDYEAIESVIAHEYFHNWTGNRVTCRDWFQLTLKEGLTVFRDQQFSADMTSAAVERIGGVRVLRTVQFAEDAGPMAHPIRPESYISMDNFYTATVYEKGAEVVRMYHTLLGPEGFRRGMDRYFERHDGQAVTCDDFRAAMADANGVDLAQFERWYAQPGTPVLDFEGEHDPAARTYTLILRQGYDDDLDAGLERKRVPLHMPVAVGLLDAKSGHDLPLRLEGEAAPHPRSTRVLELREAEQRFRFVGVPEPPVPSVLRGFSSPVRIRSERPDAELAFLMAHDSDPFNRWDAGQQLATRLLLGLADDVAAGRTLEVDPLFVEAWRRVLADDALDGSLRALALALPGERQLAQERQPVDIDALFAAREHMLETLAREAREALLETVERCAPDGPYAPERAAIDRRRLRNACLGLLARVGEPRAIAALDGQVRGADNMTDAHAALAALADTHEPERQAALRLFYERWQDDPLVLDKWFSVQALSRRPDTVERVRGLIAHPRFTLRNPNRVRSLVGAFAAANLVRFHTADGAGYALVAEVIEELDPLNPQVAARLVSAFNDWRRYDASRQRAMRERLEHIAERPGLSKDVAEIVGRALAD